jgi:hypothetical protein
VQIDVQERECIIIKAPNENYSIISLDELKIDRSELLCATYNNLCSPILPNNPPTCQRCPINFFNLGDMKCISMNDQLDNGSTGGGTEN